jgi:thymidylate synthase (FAD)
MSRASIPEMDAIIGKKFPVLNDGHVMLVDYMGDDGAIVQAARVSYGKGTKKVNEDRGLIRYLMRHRHTTPLEMCELKIRVRIPMDAWRQYIRHRTANVNEYSTRYSIAIDVCQETESHEWRLQSADNKQGSSGFTDPETGTRLTRREREFHKDAREVYEERLAAGVAKEQARKDLPLSNYTEAYWKIDLHNLFHFLSLRMDAHAQKEIRDYANVIGLELVRRWCPIAWEAFVDYRLEAMQLSRLEIMVLGALHSEGSAAAIARAASFGWLEPDPKNGHKKNREREEFEAKLMKLGEKAPWVIILEKAAIESPSVQV